MTKRAHRLVVVGTSGSGKSTLAAQLARTLGVPHIELDAIMHGPNWTERPVEEFRERLVAELDAAERGPDSSFATGPARVSQSASNDPTTRGGWVVDGNYPDRAAAIVWPRAEQIVWIDLPRRTVMRQVIWRTLRRLVLRTELWNGNRESVRFLFTHDSIVRWAWTSYAPVRARYLALAEDPDAPPVVRLTSRREVRQYCAIRAKSPVNL